VLRCAFEAEHTEDLLRTAGKLFKQAWGPRHYL